MRIDVLPVEGSPRGIIPADINGRGVGGSELFIMSLMERLGQSGHDVYFYNDPSQIGKHGNVTYLPNYAYDIDNDEKRTVVLFRGYDDRVKQGKKSKVIGISTDQYTHGDYKIDFYPAVDTMIGISEFHKRDHLSRYGSIAEKMIPMDIPVDETEYSITKKVKNQVLFCSVPDRGLNVLFDYWPEIKSRHPELQLVITSDYRLWGSPFPNNEHYVNRASGLQDVKFLGKVSRLELVKLQSESEALIYPCTYEENYCIAVAECRMAGCYPITSSVGALETTNNTFGRVDGKPSDEGFFTRFMDKIDDFFANDFETRININIGAIRMDALDKISWKKNIKKWLELFND